MDSTGPSASTQDRSQTGRATDFVPEKICWECPGGEWRLGPDEAHVWCVLLSQPQHRIDELAQCLSEEELGRAERFCFADHRNRFLTGRGWLRCLLASYLQVSPREIAFCYSERGKPFLSAVHGTDLQFNLTHSGNVALCAVARTDIGVDIEVLRPMRDIYGIARRFFAEGETKRLFALPNQLAHEGFFNCWTRKEAYLKATGAGITAALDKFEVTLAPGDPPKLIKAPSGPDETRGWSLHHLQPAPGLIGALAVKQPEIQLHCWQWPFR